MEHDVGTVFTTNLHSSDLTAAQQLNGNDNQQWSTEEASIDTIATLFKDFLREFRIGNDYLYIKMLRSNISTELYFIEVNVVHFQQFRESLSQAVTEFPGWAIQAFERGAAELATELKLINSGSKRWIQVQLYWSCDPTTIRDLAHEAISSLVCVSGIVTRTSNVRSRCVEAVVQCTSCRHKMVIPAGRGSLELPPQCVESSGNPGRRKCRPNPYVLLPTECLFQDSQVLTLQEAPEDIPPGELPRQATVVVDRYLVDKVSPGIRVHVAGIVSVRDRGGKGEASTRKTATKEGRGTVGLRAQYIKGLGIMIKSVGSGSHSVTQSVNHSFSSRLRSRAASAWQAEDEALFKRFAREIPVYNVISESIDPAVLGLKNQKRAIACLLFSGTRKRTESNYLRGDINVLFIGDPSTAKSQLLKFTQKVAPIGIYTSGKGSSAAGLTASVVGTGGGNFWLEAGSMVLADGGVVCIDEFDKMREQDQVAIHEAMEQQTISIAKASLTTMLNSRTSVLAAANPNLGSYDLEKTNEDQMDFAASILTRFDLIFKILDTKDRGMDTIIAKHIMGVHKASGPSEQGKNSTLLRKIESFSNSKGEQAAAGTFPLSFLTKYIAYAKATCFPQITKEVKATLLDFFVEVRRSSHQAAMQAGAQAGKSNTPLIQVTARQLESLVRITESLAKMRLDSYATVQDAEEAIRLFKVSTVDAIKSGATLTPLTEQQAADIMNVEHSIRRHVPVGMTVLHSRLVSELTLLGFDQRLISIALSGMIKNGELECRQQRTMLARMK